MSVNDPKTGEVSEILVPFTLTQAVNTLSVIADGANVPDESILQGLVGLETGLQKN